MMQHLKNSHCQRLFGEKLGTALASLVGSWHWGGHMVGLTDFFGTFSGLSCSLQTGQVFNNPKFLFTSGQGVCTLMFFIKCCSAAVARWLLWLWRLSFYSCQSAGLSGAWRCSNPNPSQGVCGGAGGRAIQHAIFFRLLVCKDADM